MLVDIEADVEEYDIRRSSTGQWEVYALSSGLVVVLNGSPLRGLFVEEAYQVAELLNEEQARRARGTLH